MNFFTVFKDSTEVSADPEIEAFDERLLITREFTHIDSSDYELQRLGYYWPTQVAALPLVR